MRLALVLACAHALNDVYASFVPPLLPRIMGDLGLSISSATALAVAFSIAAALPQPLFGYLADRRGRRVFAVAGPVVSGVFVSMMGWANGFWMLVGILVAAGIGSAAFHPPGASYAVRLTQGRGGGARYSVFAFGGALGFAAGPLIAVWLVQARGMRGLWIAMIPVIVAAPIVYRFLPSGRAETRETSRPPPAHFVDVLAHLRGPLGLIFGVSAIMAFVQRAFLTLEPIIVAESGGSEGLGALALSVYLAAQALGTVAGGVLADHMDRRRLLAGLCFWAVPTHLAAVWMGPEGVGLIATAMAGGLGMATLPPIVVMAQEMVPSGTSVTSGVVMGLAWATGATGVLVTGAIADVVGPRMALMASVPVALVAIALALHPALRASASTRAGRG